MLPYLHYRPCLLYIRSVGIPERVEVRKLLLGFVVHSEGVMCCSHVVADAVEELEQLEV